MITGALLVAISVGAFVGGVTIGTLREKNAQLYEELKKAKEAEEPKEEKKKNFWWC